MRSQKTEDRSQKSEVRSRAMVLSLLLVLLAFAGTARAAEIPISTASEWASKGPTLKPGDVAVFADGTYATALLSGTIQPQGTAAAPIVLTARNPGKVWFNAMDVGGAPKGDLSKAKPLHVRIEGLSFRGANLVSEFTYLTFDNCHFHGVGSGNQSAITVQWSKNITFRDCSFANVGGTRYALLITHCDYSWVQRLVVHHDKTNTSEPATPVVLYSTSNAVVKDLFITGNCDGSTGERHGGIGLSTTEGPITKAEIDGVYFKDHGRADCLNALVTSAANISGVTIRNLRADNVKGGSLFWSKTSALKIDNVIVRNGPAKVWGDQTGTVGLTRVAMNPFDGLVIPFSPEVEKRMLASMRADVPGFAGSGTLAEWLGIAAATQTTTQPTPIPLTIQKAIVAGDSNMDGIVDILDLGNVGNNWQKKYNPLTGEYEPVKP